MLRRTENVVLGIKRDLWGFIVGSRYKVLLTVGKREYVGSPRMTVAEIRGMRADSESTPVAFLSVGDRTYWCYAEQ